MIHGILRYIFYIGKANIQMYSGYLLSRPEFLRTVLEKEIIDYKVMKIFS